jgi:predicted ABC-type ATPase
VPKRHGRIVVAAGTNGAGKSVIAGEFLAARADGTYFNPDLVAKAMVDRDGLTLEQANVRAWNLGYDLLNRSIERNEDFSFETTLGGNSIAQALLRAAASGLQVLVFYVGLDSPDRHIQYLQRRFESDIRRVSPISSSCSPAPARLASTTTQMSLTTAHHALGSS